MNQWTFCSSLIQNKIIPIQSKPQSVTANILNYLSKMNMNSVSWKKCVDLNTF